MVSSQTINLGEEVDWRETYETDLRIIRKIELDLEYSNCKEEGR